MEKLTDPGFKPRVTLLDATMLVAGSMIGSGIFIVSAEITSSIGGAGYMLLMWVLAGLVTIIAAISYGELAAMFPRAGGQYVYLREAYVPLVGFLYGWAFFAVIQTGTIAAVGVAFAKFAAYVFPAFSETNVLVQTSFFQLNAAQLVSIAIITGLTYLNSRGVKDGVVVQTGLTIIKILSLVGLTAAGLIWGAKAETWEQNWQQAWTLAQLAPAADGGLNRTLLTGLASWGAIAIAMKGTLFSSDSWHSITSVAGEVKNPKKNIGLSLILGTLIVTVLYLLTNVMYLAVIPLKDIAFAPNARVGVVAAEYIFGPAGTTVMAVLIMISTFGCNNGLILAGARVYYTMAQDGLFLPKAARLNKAQVPAYSLWIQCGWACVLCLSGEYNRLLALVIFGVLIFYILTIAGIYLLRVKRPDIPRPYKAWGYPVLPAIYLIVASGLALLLLIFEKEYTLPGLGIILMGIPIYYWLLPRQQAKNVSTFDEHQNR